MNHKMMNAWVVSTFLLASAAFAGNGGSGSHGGWGVMVKSTNETYFLDDYSAYDRFGSIYLRTTTYPSFQVALNAFISRVIGMGLTADEASQLKMQLIAMDTKIRGASEMKFETGRDLRSDYVPFMIQGKYTHRGSNANHALTPIIAFWDEEDGRLEKNSDRWNRVRPYGQLCASFHEWFSTRGRSQNIQSPHQTFDAREAWLSMHNVFLAYGRDEAVQAIRVRLND